MTLRTLSIAKSFTTDAQWRAFVQMWHDNFLAAGLEQTSDAGQINIATTIKPIAANTARAGDYEMWRFKDSLATAAPNPAPIYIKVEYGTAGNLANGNLFISVGTGSDGNGVLSASGWPSSTAIIPRRAMCTGSTGVAAATAPVYFAHDTDGSFAFLAWPMANMDPVGTWFFAVERFRNADGTPNGDGVTVLQACAFTSAAILEQSTRFYMTGVTQPTGGQAHWHTIATTQGAAGAVVGTAMYPLPIFTGLPPRLAAPSQYVLALGQNDFSAGLTFACDHYGASHPWISAGPGYSTTGFGNVNGANAFLKSLAMRGD